MVTVRVATVPIHNESGAVLAVAVSYNYDPGVVPCS